MSKEMDALDAKMQKDLEMDRLRKEVQEKDLILKEHRVTRELNELVKNKSDLEMGKNVSFGTLSDEKVINLVREVDEYLDAAKKPMLFINSEFKKVVPYFRKNLILVGGDTGDGKSTSVANLIYSTITKINPATGKTGRALVLSNEERPEDFYNRVTCLIKGWKYVNHDEFTEEQRVVFRNNLPILAKNGRLTIIGDVNDGISGWTTSPEGIEQVFENLMRDKEFYDVVIIDYYQNVNQSKDNPKLDEFACQRKLANILDQMKLRYPAPIVLMAQMKRPEDEEDSTPFNVRLKGSKHICDKCTLIIEITPDRPRLRSKWKVHKGRFTESVGQTVYTGFDRGRFVPYDDDFKKRVSAIVNKNLEKIKKDELGMTGSEDETSEMEREENGQKN